MGLQDDPGSGQCRLAQSQAMIDPQGVTDWNLDHLLARHETPGMPQPPARMAQTIMVDQILRHLRHAPKGKVVRRRADDHPVELLQGPRDQPGFRQRSE
jgi:hypothetical protein